MVESSKKNDDGQKDNSKLVIGFIIIIIIIVIVVLIIVFAVSKNSSNKKEASKDDFSERTCNSQAFKERSFPAVKFDNIGYFTRKYVKQYPGPLVLEDYHGQGYTSYVAKHDDNDNEDSVVYVDETQAQELIAAKGYRKIVSQSYPNSHLDGYTCISTFQSKFNTTEFIQKMKPKKLTNDEFVVIKGIDLPDNEYPKFEKEVS